MFTRAPKRAFARSSLPPSLRAGGPVYRLDVCPAQQAVSMGFECATCGLHHAELPLCFGPQAPELWYRLPEAVQSALPSYEPTTLSLKASVQIMPLGERPTITLEATEHPLSLEQRQGITMTRVQRIAEVALHGG